MARVAHKPVDVNDAPKLTAKNYKPSGGAALHDAISTGIRVTEGMDWSDEVTFLIFTGPY